MRLFGARRRRAYDDELATLRHQSAAVIARADQIAKAIEPPEGSEHVTDTPTITPASTALTRAVRLLDKGWEPPSDDIKRLALQIEALRAAVIDLTTTTPTGSATDETIADAVRRGDRDAIVDEIRRFTLSRWLDDQCQRDGSLTGWHRQLLIAMRQAVAKDPEGVLASLEPFVDDPDAGPLIAEARGYVEQWSFRFAPGGRRVPVTPDTVTTVGGVMFGR